MASRGPEPNVTDQEILQVVETAGRPFVTITEVAMEVGLSSTRARERLNGLVQGGELNKAKVGGRAVVYWSPGE